MNPLDSAHDCSYVALQIIAEGRHQQLIAFESVLDIGRRIVRQWEAVIVCEHCRTNRQSIIVLRMVADRVLALYEAACAAYGIAPNDVVTATAVIASSNSTASGSGSSGGAAVMAARDAADEGRTSANSARSPRAESRQVVCLKSDMVLGQLELEESDARLLARTLLNRRLLRLGALLEDLKEIVVELNWAQQTDMLRACEKSITGTIDRLVTLVGQFR